jgi:hypothetical protein
MKDWKEGTLVTPYSNSDKRVFKVIKEMPITGHRYKKWYLMEHVLGEQNQLTQHPCIMKASKFRKLSQEEFDQINPKDFNTNFKSLKGEFPIDSYIKGKDRSFTRSIYKVVNYYPIPDLNINGLFVKLIEFNGKSYLKYNKEFIYPDEFDLYYPTEEKFKIINNA